MNKNQQAVGINKQDQDWQGQSEEGSDDDSDQQKGQEYFSEIKRQGSMEEEEDQGESGDLRDS